MASLTPLPRDAIPFRDNSVPSISEFDGSAQSLAAKLLAERYYLSPCMARLVCFLADIGGRFG